MSIRALLSLLLMLPLSVSCSKRAFEESSNLALTEPSSARAEPPRAAIRQLIKTVSLDIQVDGLRAARRQTEQWVAASGGFVEALESNNFGHTQLLSFTLRVPQDKLDALVAQLRGVGSVQHETQSVDDVTRKHADMDARLRNLDQTEQRLLALLAKQESALADVLAVERELSRVREEIEVLSADFRTLKEQVALSTIRLRLSVESQAEAPASVFSPWRRLWRDAGAMFAESIGALLGFGAWLVGALIYALPWSPLLALAWLGAKRWRKRRTARAG